MACSFPCLISLIVMKTLFPPELFRRVGEKRELLLKCLRRRPSPSRKSRQSLPARRQGRRQRLSGPLRRVVGLRRETVRGGAGLGLGLGAQGAAAFSWEASSVTGTQHPARLALRQFCLVFLFCFALFFGQYSNVSFLTRGVWFVRWILLAAWVSCSKGTFPSTNSIFYLFLSLSLLLVIPPSLAGPAAGWAVGVSVRGSQWWC